MAVVCRGYVRVSTEEQAEEGYSLDAQRDSIQALSDEKGWKLAGIYADEGISAKDMNRPALQRLLGELQPGEVVVCWKLDRLSRAVIDAEVIFRLFDERKVSFQSIAEPHLSTTGASGVMVRQMTTVFAEYFRRQLAENIRHGMVSKVRQGQWSGGRPPFGYDLETVMDGSGHMELHKGRPLKKLRPNATADVVRQMYVRYLRGQTPLKITTWLNSSGIQSWSGTTWCQRQVCYVLKNPIYAGLISYNPQNKTEPILVEGEHEAIVDRDLWNQVQEARELRSSLPKRQKGETYALTGVLICSECGGRIGGMTRKFTLADGHKEMYKYYRCRTRAEKGTCNVGQMSAREVEANFVTALEEQLAAPAGIAEYLEQRTKAQQQNMAAVEEERKQARRRLTQVSDALKRLDKAFLEDGVYTPAEYRERKDKYQEERRALEEEISKPLPVAETKDVSALVEQVKSIRQNWPYLTAEEKKAFAVLVCEGWGIKAILHPDKTVELKAE